MKQLTKEQAIKLFESKQYENWTSYEIVRFQLFQDHLCMPFDKFHEAMEKELGRSVWTHEFGLNLDGIKEEFLGTKEPPTFEEICDLIPEEKRIIIQS